MDYGLGLRKGVFLMTMAVLILSALVCVAMGVRILLPSPMLSEVRDWGASWGIGTTRSLSVGFQWLFGRGRRSSIGTDVMPELSTFRAGFTKANPELSSQGLIPRLLSLIGRVPPLSAARIQALNGWLGYVGSELSAPEFNGLKLLFALTACVGAATLVPGMLKNYPLLLGIVGVIGFFLPDVWLNSGVARKHKATLLLLPEVIDLLALCMGAGLDFLGALNRVVAAKATSKKKEPLLEELSIVMQEIKFGKRRSEALKAMGGRVNLPELSSFVRTLVQADRMGTPIAEVLAVHAEDVRFQRWTRAERAALKAPIKILAPLILCILPCVAIIVAAPIFIQFTHMNITSSLK